MKIKNLLLISILGALSTVWLFAQETASKSDSKADVRTITGCLSKGDSADEFLLTSNDGSTWEVRSSRVALADHVGHTVETTGVVSNARAHNLKEDAKQAGHDMGIKKNASEHGHLKVTDVKMVSESCQK